MIFKKYNFIYILIILNIILFGCNHNNKANTKPKSLNEIAKPLPVIIIGETDDSNAFKYFNIIDGSSLFGGNYRNSIKKIIKDSLYLRLDSLNQSGIMSIIAFGDSTRYRQRIFVTPGDTILLKIKNKKLEIVGKNVAHYNFFKEMKSLNFKDVYFNGDLNIYKKECKAIFDKENEFFSQYINKHKNVSDDFLLNIRATIKFGYFNNLLFVKQKKQNRYKSVMEILVDGNYQNRESILDLNNYFDEITLKDLNRPELLNNNPFKTFISSFIRVALVGPNLENYSSEKFIAEKEFILSNFNGKLQHFFIARLINDYNIFNQTDNVFNLKELIKEYKHKFLKPSYQEAIKNVESELKLIKISLNEGSLNTELLNLKGDTVLVKDVLKITKNNIRSIDFWASWCAPCITEITKGVIKRNEISKNNNIEWLYFSIDKNKDNWIKKSNELAVYGLIKNAYLVLNSKNSGLIKFLQVNKIPRYVVLNEDGIIINGNAPRPSFGNQFEKIIAGIRNSE